MVDVGAPSLLPSESFALAFARRIVAAAQANIATGRRHLLEVEMDLRAELDAVVAGDARDGWPTRPSSRATVRVVPMVLDPRSRLHIASAVAVADDDGEAAAIATDRGFALSFLVRRGALLHDGARAERIEGPAGLILPGRAREGSALERLLETLVTGRANDVRLQGYVRGRGVFHDDAHDEEAVLDVIARAAGLVILGADDAAEAVHGAATIAWSAADVAAARARAIANAG